MNIYLESFSKAFELIINVDKDLYEILFLSIRVTLVALCVACLIGLPLGTFLAIQNFFGRSIIVSIINSMMSLPPVVVGLVVYINFSRSGPFGWMGLLYTPTAMIIAQIILILPIIAGLTYQIIEDKHEHYQDLFKSLVTPKYYSVAAYIIDARFSLLTVVLAGLARGISEVGAVIIVGGNIDHLTRVITSTIALETTKGQLSLALALGFILLILAMLINFAATWHKQIGKKNNYEQT